MKDDPVDILLSRLDDGEQIDLMAWQGAVERTFLLDTQEIDRYLLETNREAVIEDDDEPPDDAPVLDWCDWCNLGGLGP